MVLIFVKTISSKPTNFNGREGLREKAFFLYGLMQASGRREGMVEKEWVEMPREGDEI
jgi:hypothetical protein